MNDCVRTEKKVSCNYQIIFNQPNQDHNHLILACKK